MLSFAWRFFASWKNFLYRTKILRSKNVFLPVVSIGNLVAGGSGKTPFTLFLAEKLLCRGKKVAILSRGYKSKAEKRGENICFSRGEKKSFEEVGDEPILLAKRLLKTLIIVGKKREKSALLAKEKGSNLLLLDDGFQYRKIKKDVEIVILNAFDPFASGKFLPRGFLRDSPAELKRADLIVVNHITNKKCFADITNLISKYTTAPIVGMRPQILGVKNLLGEIVKVTPKDRVAAFCALGAPHIFFSTVKDLGVDLVFSKKFVDHASFSISSIFEFAKKSKSLGASYIICSEKDSVKIPKSVPFPLSIYFLEIALVPIFNKNHLDNLIEKIAKMADNFTSN